MAEIYSNNFLISIEKAHLLQADVNCNSFMILCMTVQIHFAYTYQVFISLIAHSLRNELKHVAHLSAPKNFNE